MTVIARGASARALGVATTLIVAAAMTAYVSTRPLSHDVAWYLVSARWWLDGATLYRDILEINPPLAYYETAATLLLPAPAKSAFIGTVCALGAFSCMWSTWLGRRAGVLHPISLWGANLVALLIVPINEFGQREHLMVIFALPYLWANAFDVQRSRVEAITLGAFAFLGFGLKPYFLAVPVLVAIARVKQTRTWHSVLTLENWTLGLFCLGYALLIATVHPAYLGYIVPIAKLTYFAFGMPASLVLLKPGFLIALPTIALGIARGGAIAIWSASLAGAVLSYLIQFKGWNYQLLPVTCFTLIVGVMLLVTLEAKGPARLTTLATSTLALIVALIPVLQGGYQPRWSYRPLKSALTDARTVLIMGENVSLAYPLVEELGIRNESPYSALWPLPGAHIIVNQPNNPNRAKAQAVLADTRRIIVNRFIAHPPDFVVVDNAPRKPYFDGPFNYLAFLKQDKRFANIFAHYRDAGTLGAHQLYRRPDPAH